VELNYSALRRPWIDLPAASFLAEAFNRFPEITTIACVSVAETAAEKLVSLTRRTAMELAGVARVRDPTLVVEETRRALAALET
jgi:predicted nucleotidyltransferase component of viral defense system